MKKISQKHLIIIIFVIILLWGIFLVNKKINNKNPLIENAYVKNLTWETDISNSVPYAKGNLLEYVYIITPQEASKIIINIKKLASHINITKIEINWESQDIDRTLLEAEINDITTLKITWEATENSEENKNNTENNLKKIINIEVKNKLNNNLSKTNKNPEEKSNQEINNNSETEKEQTNIKNKEENKKKITDNISLNKYNFSSNIDNLIEISWNNLDNIQYINIWWNSYEPIKDEDNLYFNIQQNSFNSWEYFVLLQLKNWEILTLPQKINFIFVNDEINIAQITPNIIKNNKTKMIVLQWNGFDKIISLQLSNNIVIKNTSFEIITDNVMSVKIPEGLPVWKYHFNIMDTVWIHEIKEINFNITK
jgi:hypothetical protein